MFQKARDASVPADTIERAIKRGTGELEGVHYEIDHLRGLRAERRGVSTSSAHRQPQPHGRRDPCRSSRRTAVRSPSRARSRGSSLARASSICPKSVSEDDLMTRRARRRRRRHRRRGRRVAGHVRRRPTCRRCATRSRPRASRSTRPMSRCCPSTPFPLETAEAAKAVLRLIDLLDDNDDVDAVYSQLRHPRRDPRKPSRSEARARERSPCAADERTVAIHRPG